jgi:hypothetical protein
MSWIYQVPTPKDTSSPVYLVRHFLPLSSSYPSVSPSGLVILPAFIPPEQQRELVRWSLADHARYPNETNLDTHYHIPQDGLWNLWLDDTKEDTIIQPKVSDTKSAPPQPSGPRQLVNNAPATVNNFHSLSSSPKPPQAPSATVQSALPSELLPKLRWANIGWFYHWGTKQYDFTKGRGTIDGRVRDLCRHAVRAVDWEQVYDGFEAEWESPEPDWKSWNDTYGNISFLFSLPLTSLSCRTRCRNCQFLSGQGSDTRISLLSYFESYLDIGYPDGSRRPFRSVCHGSLGLHLVRLSTKSLPPVSNTRDQPRECSYISYRWSH